MAVPLAVPVAVAVAVAAAAIVGWLGRIRLGALTDRYGGRIVLALLSLAVIVPVVSLAFAAIGLMLLSDIALAGLVFTAWRLGTRRGTVAR